MTNATSSQIAAAVAVAVAQANEIINFTEAAMEAREYKKCNELLSAQSAANRALNIEKHILTECARIERYYEPTGAEYEADEVELARLLARVSADLNFMLENINEALAIITGFGFVVAQPQPAQTPSAQPSTIQTLHGEIIAIQTVGGYDLQIDGKTVAYAEKSAGIWRVYGRSFLTIQRAAAYVTKTYEPAPEPAEFENEVDADFLEERVLNACEIGSHLADEQAQTECEAYCAMQYEQELERVEFWRKIYTIQEYEQDIKTLCQMLDLYEKCNTLAGAFYSDMRAEIECQIKHCNECIANLQQAKTPAKTITGLADGTAKIVLITGEITVIPAQKQAEN